MHCLQDDILLTLITHFLALWPWKSCSTVLRIHFLICKMGITVVPPSQRHEQSLKWCSINVNFYYYFFRYVEPFRYYVRHIPNLLYRAIIQAPYKIGWYDDFSPEFCSLIKNESPRYQRPACWVSVPFPTTRHFPDVCSTSLTFGTEDQFASTPTWLHLSHYYVIFIKLSWECTNFFSLCF